MLQTLNINKNLNEFLQIVVLKKQYLNKLKLKLSFFKNSNIKNNRLILTKFFISLFKNIKNLNNNLITYIIDITFSKSNIFINVINIKKIIKLSVCSGNLFYKGKNKKAKILVLKSIIQILITKLKFLSTKPLALHLKNVSFTKWWVIQKIKSKFFIKTIKNFIIYNYNGCRLAKLKRKK